jgi:hypothetical protein
MAIQDGDVFPFSFGPGFVVKPIPNIKNVNKN